MAAVTRSWTAALTRSGRDRARETEADETPATRATSCTVGPRATRAWRRRTVVMSPFARPVTALPHNQDLRLRVTCAQPTIMYLLQNMSCANDYSNALP